MRTTLDLDDDLLVAAKQLARERRQTAGQVISDLVRLALEPKKPLRFRNGVPLLPFKSGTKRATMELVNKLRDDE